MINLSVNDLVSVHRVSRRKAKKGRPVGDSNIQRPSYLREPNDEQGASTVRRFVHTRHDEVIRQSRSGNLSGHDTGHNSPDDGIILMYL